jgi:hypothetical protein
MAWTERVWRERIAVAATALVSACGGDDEKDPTGNSGSIQLAVNPAALSVEQGSSGSVTVSLTRSGGFTGVVSLAVTGLPAGITASVSPAQLSASETSATVSATAAAAVPANTYTATITATAQGVSQATASYQLTVTAPTGAGKDVEYRFCDPSQAPIFFAYQDGSGVWRPVTGSTTQGTTKFAFKIAQNRGGVLAVYRTASAVTGALQVGVGRPHSERMRWSPEMRDRMRERAGFADQSVRAADQSLVADEYETDVLYASPTELTQDGIDNCAISQPTKSVKATVSGVSNGQFGVLSLGGASELFIGGTTTNPVTFDGVPTGPVDFIGTRMTTPGVPPDKAIILRNLNIPDGGSLPSTIDFNAASLVPATATATITGGGADELEIFTELVTATSRLLMWFDLAPSTTSTRPWAGIPASAMTTSDFHAVVVFASPSNTSNYRVSLKYVGPVAAVTLALGPTLANPASSQVTAGTYPRFRFQGAIPSEYNKGAAIDIASTLDVGNVFSIIATSTYLAAAGNALAYDFTMPDVAGLAGFPVAARLTAGVNEVSASGFGFTGPGIFDLEPNLGSEFKAGARGFTINVP